MMPQGVPQGWFEWWSSVFDPDVYILQRQSFGVSIAAAANTAGQQGNIQVPEPLYVFGVRSYAIVTSSGLRPTIGYRIGFKASNGNDWFNGQWEAGMVTGDGVGTGFAPVVYPDWDWPRELAQNDIITAVVDNTVMSSAVAITVDAMLTGYAVRRRTSPIERR